MPGSLRSAGSGPRHVDALERHLDRMDQPTPTKRKTRRRTMTDREQYAPGPASGAQVRKDGEKWTLILVRELRHSPDKVWQALTDPAQLREWAPFDADGSLGTAGSTVKLTTVGAPHAARDRNHGDASRRAQGARVQLGRQGYAVGARSRWRRHAPDAVAQHRSPLHLDGCRRLAHLFRRAGSPARRNAHRPHRGRRRA